MHRLRTRNITIAFALMIPAFVIYTVFFIIPIFDTVALSFHRWNGIGRIPWEFIGFDNYRALLDDATFHRSLINVLIFFVVSVIILMPISFFLAYLIYAGLKRKGFFKTVFYFPTILPMAATGLMWVLLLTRSGGAINTILGAIGLPSDIHWLGDMQLVTWTVALVNAWIFAGQNMLFFLAGLASVPTEIVEASTVDGAHGFKRMWHIILPSIKESFKTFLVLSITGSVRVFDIIFVMTGGGPGTASEVPATLLYRSSFIHNQFGYGSAIGVVMLVISLLGAFILTKTFNRMDK